MKKLILIAALALLFSTGCFRTTVINSQGGAPSPVATAMWYHGIIGLVDLSGPLDLNQLCAGGSWTRIDIRTGILNSFISYLTGYIYTPQTATVFCGDGVAYDTITDGDGKVVYAMPAKQGSQ